jgi:hypothetical protein
VLRAEGGTSRVHRNDSVRAGNAASLALGKAAKPGSSAARLQGVGAMSIAQRMAQRNKLTTPGGGPGAGGVGAVDTPPRTAEGHADGAGGLGEDGEGGEADVVPDIPPSWVSRLSIPRDAFDMRCPRVGSCVYGPVGSYPTHGFVSSQPWK